MRKTILFGAILAVITLCLTSCSSIGDKALSISAIYGVTAVLAALILLGYLTLCKSRSRWFLLLLSSITLTNTGYWLLATSATLDGALMANRLSYLGSVFLPMAMLMIILNVTRTHYPKWLPAALTGLSLMVFAVAASPGYLDIYYAEASIATINGTTVLQKVYGPWHRLYLFYLLGYFAATTGATASAIITHKIPNAVHAILLSLALFLNVSVWLLEQLVKVEFELLSVSYIITELFLLGLDLMLWEQRRQEPPAIIAEPAVVEPAVVEPAVIEPAVVEPAVIEPAVIEPAVIEPAVEEPPAPRMDKTAYFAAQLPTLTPTERLVYDQYLAGKSSKEIMEALDIKENTLKYHNRNIYSKLGISSRKQMFELAALTHALPHAESRDNP